MVAWSLEILQICSVCRNGAGPPPNLISTSTTGKGCTAFRLVVMLPPIRILSDKKDSKSCNKVVYYIYSKFLC